MALSLDHDTRVTRRRHQRGPHSEDGHHGPARPQCELVALLLRLAMPQPMLSLKHVNICAAIRKGQSGRCQYLQNLEAGMARSHAPVRSSFEAHAFQSSDIGCLRELRSRRTHSGLQISFALVVHRCTYRLYVYIIVLFFLVLSFECNEQLFYSLERKLAPAVE